MSNSLYSNEVRQLVHSVNWPHGLIVDVVEYPDSLVLRFYRDNFEEIPDSSRLVASEQLERLIKKVRSLGCPCYFEVEAHVPK